ncbi:2-dehydro-3-deoxygalactonokinase [Microvirga lotononidis]|uniref:2-keto-3-deoxy-galactonokinase n=1 Tax=Microvirga lotononidis TaxID=864069 RepID=I4YQT2_9HYPH|nr:2-dehydro-3-deoxygalactonokinase [Microvirga lotononidis]EIM26324.1 2-keto-3-deoxy-galactonokinase [Microvirga lotononidis]WQO30696.1 2-dehydro-3-deoxygalactonokinase [Microvirga lotononidis]
MTLDVTRLRIILDWGTTSFRALLVTPDGTVRDRIETEEGIQSVREGDFLGVLQRAIAPWRAAYGFLPVYAAGMIGSRNGWIEMPYVPTPADSRDLAAQVKNLPLPDGGTITFLPGLTDRSAHPFPDVMRGEETQLVGFGLDKDITVVLPGTHAKWARIAGRRIAAFQTLVTGEIFSTLSRHSFLSKVARRPATSNWDAFLKGVALVRDDKRTAGLLTHLFAVRTGWLSGALVPEQMTDYLSGLVVASEFREAKALGWFTDGDRIAVVGDDDLVEVYERVAGAFGLSLEPAPEDAAVRGCLAVARIAEDIHPAA